jgi:hypothetical protein
METADRHGLLTSAKRLYLDAFVAAKSEDERVRIDATFAGALPGTFEEVGAILAGHLKDDAPRTLEEHRLFRDEFEQGLLAYWSEALDALYAVYIVAVEMGGEFNQEHRAEALEEQDFVFDALIGLHARACVAMSEIHALLRACRVHELNMASLFQAEQFFG